MYLNTAKSNNHLAQYYADQYQPSAGRLFGASLKFGFDTLWFNELIQEQLYDQASQEQAITQEEYKNSRYYRNGVKWFDGMTLGQAEILSENQDRKAYYANLTRNVDTFSGLGLTSFGGMLAGSIPDPLNFIPYWGIAKNVMRVKKLSKAMHRIRSAQMVGKVKNYTPTGKTVLTMVDPMIGAGLATYMVQDKRKKFQEEWDMSMVLTDALIAGGIGFSMWGAGKFANRIKKSPREEITDKIARGTEQIEEVPFGGPDLKPDGGAGGINFGLPFNRAIRTMHGSLLLDGVVKVNENIYARVEAINVNTPEDALNAVHETLDVMNAEGFQGIHISDNIDDEVLQTLVENLDMTSMKLETRPDSNGHTIERVQDDANWNYVKRDEEPLKDPDQEAEIAMARDSEVETDYNASFEADKSFTANMSRMSEADTVSADAQRIQDGINQATSCVIKNG